MIALQGARKRWGRRVRRRWRISTTIMMVTSCTLGNEKHDIWDEGSIKNFKKKTFFSLGEKRKAVDTV